MFGTISSGSSIGTRLFMHRCLKEGGCDLPGNQQKSGESKKRKISCAFPRDHLLSHHATDSVMQQLLTQRRIPGLDVTTMNLKYLL